jgi:hypothetical protein
VANYAYWPHSARFLLRKAAHRGELCPDGQGRLRKIRLATFMAVNSYGFFMTV